MNFEEYERKYEALYDEFAETVKGVLEKAIAATPGTRRPQSLQCRAKAAASLKVKLADRGKLESTSIEQEVKDLAGVRLIFYTNSDVDRFLITRLIPENFEVDWDDTKIHHPTEENAERRYQAIHYTVRFASNRTRLPEYAKFADLRCEIQIQTVLNHAWAETSHDILYKSPEAAGFGTKAFQAIEKRMNKAMDAYLVPAGYELQKVQHDFERLMQGKALFDRGTIETLKRCIDNNERHEVLSTISEYVIPNYDDIEAIYPELRSALVDAVRAARKFEIKAIPSAFGDFPGKAPQDVTRIVADILSNLRYVNVEGTFLALINIYRDEPDGNAREHILKVIKTLAEHNLQVWEKVGCHAQSVLADALERLTPEDRVSLRPVILTVWREMLGSVVTGTSFSGHSFSIRTGAIQLSEALKAIREKSVAGLIELFDRSSTEGEKREILSVLDEATRLPYQANYSNELCAQIFVDTKQIVELLGERVAGQPYELLQHFEHRLLFHYRQALDVANDEENRFGCKEVALALITAILRVRDQLNTNTRYIQHKTLVGFEGVFPPSWENDEFDFNGLEQYRLARADEYVVALSVETEDEWYRVIERCAATKSEDLATFPIFGQFLYRLARAKPEIAARLLKRANANVLNFLPAFLNGLCDSEATDLYEAVLVGYVTSGRQLTAVVHHLRLKKNANRDLLGTLLTNAVATNDEYAVIGILLVAVQQHHECDLPLVDAIFMPAITHLTGQKNTRWIHGAWHMPETPSFLSHLSADQAELVLDSFQHVDRIDHVAERILSCIAEKYPRLVWDFFGLRMNDKREEGSSGPYEAIPYQFHGLEKPLSADVNAGVSTVRNWYHSGDSLFRFTGGRLLSAAFPNFSAPLSAKFQAMLTNASDEDIEFVMSVLVNYRGEPATHDVVKALIDRVPPGDPRIARIEMCLEETGVVTGEFGFVDAFRRKKEGIATWLTDSRPRIVSFAERYIKKLDRRIASEKRSAEMRKEMQRRDFEPEDDE
jgi:ppGpp synthetase/RelA/SpoT-type nucleotidyltranferase